MNRRFNTILRSLLLGSRWAMAPFCLGLLAALVLLLAEFFRRLTEIVTGFAELAGSAIIPPVLKLVDLVLIGNLVVMIIIACVEVFLPATKGDGESPVMVGFGSLKTRLFASISAIAAVELLETFMNIDARSKEGVLWEVVILLVLAIAGVLLALMDRLEGERH